MAHSIAKAFKVKKSDELYTPRILVDPLMKHIDIWAKKYTKLYKRPPIILCPFDTVTSEYVKLLTTQYEVKFGHLATGQDFFLHDYGEWDICISNPPFSLKKKVYERLYELDKPFVLLGNVMQLNYMEIGSLFADHPIQLLLFDKRVSFDGHPSSFASGYFCYNFLEKDLIFEHLSHCNSGKDFVPSNMYCCPQLLMAKIKTVPNDIVIPKLIKRSTMFAMQNANDIDAYNGKLTIKMTDSGHKNIYDAMLYWMNYGKKNSN